MKRKRLLSTAVAGMLVAAQMVMPVMATGDGGKVEVDVTTRTAVIRVEVPTSLAIAVNQFEKGDAGSQIYSEPFTIKNKSEIPVKIEVTSTATLDSANPITLVTTKAAAEASEDEEAWVAVAAMTSANKYIEDSSKGIKDLDETSENVTTFEQDSEAPDTATAVQTFYLGTVDLGEGETAPAVTYNIVDGTDADELANAKKISYAQFYEVNKETLTTDSEQDDLDALLADGDVYVVDGSGNVSIVEKGDSHSYAAAEAYYTIVITAPATEPVRVEAGALATGKYYVYGEAGAGDAAGFRYIGKLSEGKPSWVAADINHVKIEYDITGVTTTKYDTLKDDCTYGLYAGTGTGSGSTSSVEEGVIAQFAKGAPTSILSTATELAERLQSGTVQFILDDSSIQKVKDNSLTVTKIVIDGKTYNTSEITVTANANASEKSDGNTYKLTGFTANTVSSVEVYYGDNFVVKYNFN